MDVRIQDPLELSLPPVTLDWSLNFESEELKRAFAYWKMSCGERERPERADLTPSGMSHFLRHVALIEVRWQSSTVRAYRVRLAGTYVEQVFGPITGQRIDHALPAAIATRWHECLETVFKADRPLRLTGRVGFENKSWLSGEVLIAPLGDSARPIEMMFAAFYWKPVKARLASLA